MGKYYFKPTGDTFPTQKELESAKERFYAGDLSEEFAFYCAKKCVHAFWINYKDREKKIDKEEFCKRFTEIINAMLKEL